MYRRHGDVPGILSCRLPYHVHVCPIRCVFIPLGDTGHTSSTSLLTLSTSLPGNVPALGGSQSYSEIQRALPPMPRRAITHVQTPLPGTFLNKFAIVKVIIYLVVCPKVFDVWPAVLEMSACVLAFGVTTRVSLADCLFVCPCLPVRFGLLDVLALAPWSRFPTGLMFGGVWPGCPALRLFC